MNDYKHTRINGVLLHAHRVAWEREHGQIPEGMLVHHICGDKSCVDVSHLQLVTPRQHLAIHGSLRESWKEKRERSHCVNGHEFTPENTYRRTRAEGGRSCRACHAARERERREQKKMHRSPATFLSIAKL